MQIVTYPNEILTNICTNTDFPTLDEALGAYDIMKKHNGIGIAAPQVGLDKRFFWMFDEICINPKISGVSKASEFVSEGCLSLPGQQFKIERHFAISVSYYSYLGKYTKGCGLITKILAGTESIVFQHEYDHLDGILINADRSRRLLRGKR